jgi:hypothetical protein
MTTPYREVPATESHSASARDLVYVARDADRKLAPMRAYFTGALAAAILMILMMLAGLPTAGALAAAAATGIGLVWCVVRWRRAGVETSGLLLRVEDGHLLLFSNRSGTGLPLRLSLAALETVRLETKTIEKMQREVRADGLLGFGATMTVDNSRIVFVLSRKSPVYLTDEYVSHTDCLEWLGKIRLFLRGNGWVPADERRARSRVTKAALPATATA